MHTAPGRTASHSAFTLIETMLALVIVTMLATLIVPSLLSLRADATTDRAKAEITSALSDARSLARARSMPVIVSLSAPDASGESEITATVITAVENIASALSTGEPAEERPGDSPDDVARSPESDAPIAESPAAQAVTRRLGILPSGCRLAQVSKGDASAPPAGKLGTTPAPAPSPTPASIPASTMLAMVFPDGTASVPRRSLELTVTHARTTPRVFAVLLSPWFAEATFTEIFPSTDTTPSDTSLSDADTTSDEASTDEVPR